MTGLVQIAIIFNVKYALNKNYTIAKQYTHSNRIHIDLKSSL